MFDWGRARSIALFLAIGLAIGAVAINPAVGGGLFTKKKALGLFYTKHDSDARFLTTQAADAKFLTPAEGDSRYLPSSGSTQLQVSPDQWEAGTGTGNTVTRITPLTHLNGGTGLQFFNAGLVLPSQIQGRPVKIENFELCYRVNASALLDRVFLAKSTATSGNIAPAPTFPIDDDTDRPAGEATCRTYAGAAPVSIGAQDVIQIEVRSNNASTSSIDVSRLTVNLSD